ncbi:MAG: homoserine kinase [Chthoniobacterales bacterium]
MNSITVSIPATTSNIGPGFDCFGIALHIFNHVTIEKKETSSSLPVIVQEAADSFFKTSNLPSFPFLMTVVGDVPQSRGLGSSATIRLGLIMALNRFENSPFSPSDLYALCAALEGHPDNTAPAIFGGFTIARKNHLPLRFSVSPELRFILLIPDFEVSTTAARRLMPQTISVADATSNIANASVIATAFATGDYELLRESFDDKLHQPFRKALVPFLPEVLNAATSAGALGGWLSGSGSTIAALALNHSSAELIAAAMEKATPGKCRTIITTIDNSGARIRLKTKD